MADTEEDEVGEEEAEDDNDEDDNDEYDYLNEPEHGRKPAGPAMAYESTTLSMLRLRSTMQTQRLDLAREKEAARLADKATLAFGAADNLRAMLKHRHRTFTAGWRLAIDRTSTHRVEASKFFEAMRMLGIPDDYKVVWSELSGNRGHVTLADIDATSARLLSDFFKGYKQKIGRDISDLVKDTDNLRVDQAGFLTRCEKLKSVVSGDGLLSLKGVFRALQLGSPAVAMSDLEWLESYCMRGEENEPTEEEKAKDKALEKAKEDELEKTTQQKLLLDFKILMRHKYGGLIQAWRQLIDPEKHGRISSDDLRVAAAKIGFIEGYETMEDKLQNDNLWKALTGPKGFVLTLEEFEPAAVPALESFKKGCIARFGSVPVAFRELMAKQKPLVTKGEFIAWCKEVRTDAGSDKLLWNYLDEGCVGMILMDSIDRDITTHVFTPEQIDKANDIFQELEPMNKASNLHMTLVERATETMAITKRPPEELKNHQATLLKQLQTKFGSTVRAWRKAIDPQGKGKLSRDEFFVGCAVAGFGGQLPIVWKEMGLKEKSHVRLKDLDPSTGEEVRIFRERCLDNAGSVHDALCKVSKTKSKLNPKVTVDEFKTLHRGLGLEGDHEKLFAHLDAHGRGAISASSLKWLKDIPDTEEKALARNLTKQVEVRKKQCLEKRKANCVPTPASALQEQKAKSDECKQKRGATKEMEEMRAKLLKTLANDYHSIGRGWQIAFDIDRAVELQIDDFLTGLERISMLKQNASDEDLAKAEQLFHFLEAEPNCGVVTLACLDRGQTDRALQDLLHHLAFRFSSVQTAFEMCDPGGTGEVSIAEFTRMCHEAKFTSAIHRVVQFLDPDLTGIIYLNLIDHEDADAAKEAVKVEKARKKTLHMQQKRHRPAYSRPTPSIGVSCGVKHRDKQREAGEGTQLIKAFKKACVAKYGSLGTAWQKSLSPDGGDTIDYDAFEKTFTELKVEGEAEDTWEAMGCDELTLRELDPSVEQDVKEFCARLVERFGSVANAIDESDTMAADCNKLHVHGSYELDYNAFCAVCFECQFRRNERRLFEYYGGVYGVKESKISLGKIDGDAFEIAKTKREEYEASKKAFEDAQKKRFEAQARRRLGKPDDLSPEEMAQAELARFEAEAKQAAAAEKEKQQRERLGSANTDASSVRSGSQTDDGQKKMLAPPAPPLPVRAGEDPAKVFVAVLHRRFGTTTRAWRVLDCQKQVALNKKEFSSALRVCGYGGSSSVLWDALGAKQFVSLKDIDGEAWKRLAAFRIKCHRRLKGLRKMFRNKHSPDNEYSVRLDFDAFSKICAKVGLPQVDVIFDLLDVKCVGSVTWEEVKFLEEDYKWIKQNAMAVRKDATPLGGSRNADLPDRVSGIGHLGLDMKPRKVFLPKSNSLPDINPQLRPNWNERHTMFDTIDNSTDQLIHLMKYVKVEEETRIARRVQKKLLEVPTEQWLNENMPSYADIEEEDDDDGDDGFGVTAR